MIKVKPNCRYGHGDLVRFASKNAPEKWGYMSHANGASIFSGDLFICPVCGYTELFDDDVEQTKKDLGDSHEPA